MNIDDDSNIDGRRQEDLSGETEIGTEAETGRSVSFPSLPEELERGSHNWTRLLLYFGPGAVLASATLGSGELLFAPRGGAIFGYSMLWALVWAGIMKGIVVYSGVRYYTLTGENIMSRWAKLPGPRGWFTLMMAFLAFIAFPSWIGGLALMLGEATAWTLGLPVTNTVSAAIATIMVVATAILVVVGGYDLLEKSQIAIVVFLSAAIAILAITARPSLSGVLGGLIPSVPSQYEPFVRQEYPGIASRPIWVEVVTYMGAVGGGIYDYIGYVGMTKNRGWGMLGRSDSNEVSDLMREIAPGKDLPLDEDSENLLVGRSWLKAPQTDVLISFTTITFFTAASMILGAIILRENQLIPSELQLFQVQAQWFTQINPGLEILWQVGVFFALFGALYSLWEIYTWSGLECFKPFSARVRNLERNNLSTARLLTIAYVGGIALILIWSDLSAVAIVTPAALLGGVFGCGLWCWAMLWAEKTSLPKEWQGGWKLDLGLIIAGTFLTLAGLIAIGEYIGILSV